MRRAVLVFLGFVALTAVVTFPQALQLASAVPHHTDPYFSMWRLGWVAHAISHDIRSLFDANIFFPAPATLAYSDAMLLPGVALAPLFWAGLSPVLIYNSVLLTAFALSGFTAFVLVRELTSDTAASVIAGVVFAFSPYRFTHFPHLELQLVFWMPIVLLLVHRIVARGGRRSGLFLGLVVAAQLLSSIYTAIFLVTYLLVFVPVLVFVGDRPGVKKIVGPFILSCLVALAVAPPYLIVYGRAKAVVGTRSLGEVRRYSAGASNYLSAPAINRLYGRTAITDPIVVDEMNLFPSVTATLMSLVGVLKGRGRARFAYLAGLLLSIDMTAGANGVIYPWLFEHIGVFRALRSAARFDILITLSLAVLSGYGAAFLLATIRNPGRRRAAAIVIGSLLVAECASAPTLESAPAPSRVDRLLATKAPSVVMEVPLVGRGAIWGSLDYQYIYQGIPHFQRMLNGYSGYAPPSYYKMREVMASFPDDAAIRFLRESNVNYVVVRSGLYEEAERTDVENRLANRGDLVLEASWTDGPDGAESLYSIK